MKEFDKLKDMIYSELDEISHAGKLDKASVCLIGELVDILKDMGSVEMFEENIYVEDNGMYHTPEERGGYSNRMPRSGRYDGGYGYSYDNGYNGYSRGGNSRYYRNNGYSRTDSKEHMVEKLEQLMMEATDQHDKDSIRQLIDQMHNN